MADLQIVSVTPFPAHIGQVGGDRVGIPNGITVNWQALENFYVTYAELDTPSGAKVWALNIGKATSSLSGSELVEPPTPGDTYLVKLGGGITPGEPQTYSQSVRVTAAVNYTSVNGFLAFSGLTGNNGIKQYLPNPTHASTISLGQLMGVG
jgi:hypothetical protein